MARQRQLEWVAGMAWAARTVSRGELGMLGCDGAYIQAKGEAQPMVLSRALLVLLVVSTAGAALPRPAHAEVQLRDLRLSATPGGTASQRFEPGTRVVYARFVYKDAFDERLGVVVLARGGLAVFESWQRYTGDGTSVVPIDGTSMNHAMASRLLEAAVAAQENADRAASQAHGVQEYLAAVRQDLLLIETAAELLATSPVGEANLGRLNTIRVALAEALRLTRRAIALPPEEVEGKRALAEQLRGPLGIISSEAEPLGRSVSRLGDLPIPTTGPDPTWSYVVQVRVRDRRGAALSAEFLVARQPPALLPWLGKSARVGR